MGSGGGRHAAQRKVLRHPLPQGRGRATLGMRADAATCHDWMELHLSRCTLYLGETSCFDAGISVELRPATVSEESALIIYDGDCIFCQNYARYVRLREAVGKVELLDARSRDPRLSTYWQRGYDLNEGMLFVYKGKAYYGSDAVHVLAGLSSPISWFNRLNRTIFSNRAASAVLYPLLKIGRRLTLFARGKTLINDPTLEN